MSQGMIIIMTKPNAFLWKACHLTFEAYKMDCTIEECFILCNVLSFRASVRCGLVFVEVMSWCHVGSQFMFLKFLKLKYNFKYILLIQHVNGLEEWSSVAVFLNRRAAARYRALASIIPGRERPDETTICCKVSLVQLITNLNVILYLSTSHTVYVSILMP